MTILSEFYLKDLLPGDIFVSEDTIRMWSVTPGKNHLIVGAPKLDREARSNFLSRLWCIEALNLTTRIKETIFHSEDEILDGVIYRDGEIIWDYENRP